MHNTTTKRKRLTLRVTDFPELPRHRFDAIPAHGVTVLAHPHDVLVKLHFGVLRQAYRPGRSRWLKKKSQKNHRKVMEAGAVGGGVGVAASPKPFEY